MMAGKMTVKKIILITAYALIVLPGCNREEPPPLQGPGRSLPEPGDMPRLHGPDPSEKPNLIIISIDTLRADHLGAYGYERATSPNIDALAEEGALFENCIAQSSWTPTSVGSLFTSFYPPQHGSFGRDRIPLAPANLTIAEILRDRGYHTAAFSSSPFIHPDFGFGQGFIDFMFDPAEKAESLNALAFEWLKQTRSGPVFLYVMYFDPHFPYTPPPPYDRMFQRGRGGKDLWEPSRVTRLNSLFDLNATVGRETYEFLKSRYDGEVAYADAQLGFLLAAMKKAGLLENAVLVVTADHGEEFLEHGAFGHGNTLYTEVLRVPLIIKAAAVTRAGTRIKKTVRQIDLMPTALELLGVEAPHKVEGESLVNLLKDPDSGPDRPAYAATRHLFHQDETMRSLRESGDKIIITQNPDRAELFDLSEDYPEQNNIAFKDPERLKVMSDRLVDFEKAMLPPPAGGGGIPAPERTRELLRSLGYIGP
jgi:arylsulfatase A-like enzyme